MNRNYKPARLDKLFQSGVGRVTNDPSKDIHILIPGICDCYLIGRKRGGGFADVIKDLEMDRSSWITHVGPKCNHMYPSKREAQGY